MRSRSLSIQNDYDMSTSKKTEPVLKSHLCRLLFNLQILTSNCAK